MPLSHPNIHADCPLLIYKKESSHEVFWSFPSEIFRKTSMETHFVAFTGHMALFLNVSWDARRIKISHKHGAAWLDV